MGREPLVAGDSDVELVVLVLGHESLPYSVNEALQRSTWADEASCDPRVRIYWVYADPTARSVREEPTRELFIPVAGREPEGMGNSIVLEKTVGAVLWALERFHPRYVLRTNTSSYHHIPEMLRELSALETHGVYRGVIGTDQDKSLGKIDFVSGASMLMTPDVAMRLATLDASGYPELLEDVALGAFLEAQGVEPQGATRVDVSDGEPLRFGSFVRLKSYVSDQTTQRRMVEVDEIFSETDADARLTKLKEHDRREAARIYRQRISSELLLTARPFVYRATRALLSTLNLRGYLDERRNRNSSLAARSNTFEGVPSREQNDAI